MIKDILKFLLGILVIAFLPILAVLYLLWHIWGIFYHIGNEAIKQINQFRAKYD
jgi:uncharacterized membrane protein YbhN (UPF0104 family)